MNVILATNQIDLDEALVSSQLFNIIGVVETKENLLMLAEKARPEVVLLSGFLPGKTDILDVAYNLRTLNTRIVFLAGELTKDDITIKKLLDLGVYDFLFNPVTFGQVQEKLLTPTPFSEVAHLKQGQEGFNAQQQETKFKPLVRIGEAAQKIIKQTNTKKIKKDELVTDNAIMVWSPFSSGSTFIAINLATVAFSRGIKPVLLDLDTKHLSVHTWLNLHPGEQGLYETLKTNEDPWAFAAAIKYCPGIGIFTADPMEGRENISERQVLSLLDALDGSCELVVVDAPSDTENPITKALLSVCDRVLLVVDQDYNHLLQLQLLLSKLEKQNIDFDKFSVVVNKYIESERIPLSDIEKAVGLKVDYTVPEATKDVFESVKKGIPVALFNGQVKSSLLRVID